MEQCHFCKNMFGNTQMLRQHQKKTKYCLKIQETTAKENEDLILKANSAELKCQYCKKNFKNKYVLHNHQTQAKYCIKIQESQNAHVISTLETCIHCNKNFSTASFNRHKSTCKKTKEFLNEEIIKLKTQQEIYKNIAERAQTTIEEIAKKPWETVVEIEQETETPEEPTDEPYELVPLELDNGYIIESREEDGYINITNLCKAGRKEFKHWNSLAKTKAFLKALSTAVGIPTAVLIHLGTESKFGTTEETSGTWVHPQVAINIAQWISPQFDVKVSAWVLEVMMTGKIDITNTKSYRELQQDNKNKQLKIQLMTKKYVKKQPRTQYNERNVIYILTTANMKKERRYILGKATNLTSRLSVYNKSDEHEVVYYQECPNEEKMGLVESFVFCKLNEYREQANRERFLLPEGTSIDFFSDTIRECIAFIK
jgi:hypothetical protein